MNIMSLFLLYAITSFALAGIFKTLEVSQVLIDKGQIWFGASPVLALVITPILIKLLRPLFKETEELI